MKGHPEIVAPPKVEAGHIVQRRVKDNVLSKVTLDPNRNAALELNARLRIEGIVQKRPDLHWSLSIPDLDYAKLTRLNPDLESTDADIKGAAWKKFIRSPESLPYRVMA